MKLSERLNRSSREEIPVPVKEKSLVGTESYQEIKSKIHSMLIERLDLNTLDTISTSQLQAEIRSVLGNIIRNEAIPLNQSERESLIDEVIDEIMGLGPLEPLLRDTTISDILVNTYSKVYVERAGQLSATNVRFKNNDHLLQIIDRIVSRVGRRVDETSPMVDARLQDGSRVNAIIPPLAIDGPLLSIRRFGSHPLTLKQLIENESLTEEMAELLKAAVQSKLNIVIAGGTGSGKTTLLNMLSSFIPPTERIVTIEDSAELQLQQEHVVRLETRPPNIEGKGEVTQRDLVKNTLRMRPDRIVIGEVRGAECLDMLQAMNTGHEGSLTTIHANTPRDALSRLETMVSMSGLNLSDLALRQQTARAIELIVQCNRLPDGKRRIVSISEIVGMEGNIITMQDIHKFEQTSVEDEGNIIGILKSTGIVPKCLDKIKRNGIQLSENVFSFHRTVGAMRNGEFTGDTDPGSVPSVH